ncbi:MAG: FAD-binding protein [Bacteroidia bacterium]|nr:MAG: FAD-binding protein [Bacteroidia bacterium]
MSDKLFPLPLGQLLSITLHELDHKDSFFGIPAALFYDPTAQNGPFRNTMLHSTVFGKRLHTPLGVAAGPHSQMAQNIVAAWLLGARYMELKTVQTLDELEVSKPCIDMQDEGYNCEWSQELKIRQSFEEYLHAWIMIHLLNHRFGWGNDPGLIFNMSVGYNLEGIMKDNVQWFFDQMNDCSEALAAKMDEIRPLYPGIDTIKIPAQLSDNITLSTMHGCPAGEIESIAGYLMEDKKLHTYVKLNPTLLGAEKLREILNQKLGFLTEVPDQAFVHDLAYKDALSIIKNLQKTAAKNNLEFGLKLTNTLESLNNKDVFGSDVENMYMSGRALHPLTVNLAYLLQKDFGGKLQLSFSGGADAFNAGALLACGFKTITTCTDLLKPGGMMRLPQYLENIAGEMQKSGAGDPDSFVMKYALPDDRGKDAGTAHAEGNTVLPDGEAGIRESVIVENLRKYAGMVVESPAYKMGYLTPPNIKTERRLGLFDCIAAPCRETCATGQDIPEYMWHTSRGEFREAHGVILRTNPFPSVTGMICDHLCQNKCTRVHYDDPLHIREVKRFNSGQQEPELRPASPNGLRVAVIGAGPAGLSCAYFLALAGFSVEVFERASRAGGMVQYAIPGFRLTDEAMDKDLERITSLGVKVSYNTRVDGEMFDRLRKNFDFVFAGTGAPLSAPLNIEGIRSQGVLDPLDFLFRVRAGEQVTIGNRVVVIGGGNTAMDAARTAYRLVGEKGKVTIVYRRTFHEMPADQGEIRAALEEGVEFMELCGPEEVITADGRVKALRCSRMELKEADESGRRRPVKISGSTFEIPCDSLIPAVGQVVDTGFMDNKDLATREGSYLTRIGNVFTGGDAMRGASTAINAIGDGRKAAAEVIHAAGLTEKLLQTHTQKAHDPAEIMQQRSKRVFAPRIEELPLNDRKNFKLVQTPLGQTDIVAEASRCLHCDELCNTCVTVCPNLANYPYHIEKFRFPIQKIQRSKDGSPEIKNNGIFSVEQGVQIMNIADFCNECGNCMTFCPTADAPYLVKPKLHLSIASFYDAGDGYYLSRLENASNLIGKENGQLFTLSEQENQYVFETTEAIVTLGKEDFSVKDVQFLQKEATEVSLDRAASMLVILQGAKALGHR